MLKKQLTQIESYFDKIEALNKKVSKSNVGWHLDHSLKVINSVVNALVTSDPKKYSPQFSLKRRIVFASGFFPRGRAKSPKKVLPPEIILLKDLQEQVMEAAEGLGSIKELDNNTFFTHPIFKQLNKKQTIKFLKLHTNHHLKIINDILK